MKLIGLSGYAKSGKSVVAQRLVNKHGYTLIKFAAPLKAMLRVLGLSDREIEGDLKELPCPTLGGITPRHAMQTLGTEWGRNSMYKNFWADRARDMVLDVLDHGGKVVMDDCRFANEGEMVKALRGEVWGIRRPGIGPVNGHVSESEPPELDRLLHNTDTIEFLELVVDHIIEGGKQ